MEQTSIKYKPQLIEMALQYELEVLKKLITESLYPKKLFHYSISEQEFVSWNQQLLQKGSYSKAAEESYLWLH